MQGRRVVVTGMGLISPVGNTCKQAWHNVVSGVSGVTFDDSLLSDAYPSKISARVKNFSITGYGLSLREGRRMDPFIHYGLAAAIDAFKDAGLLELSENDSTRAGVLIGTGMGGMHLIEEQHSLLLERGPQKVSPFFISSSLVNMLAGQVSIHLGLRGPNLSLATACSTGTHAIGIAARTIAYGDADIMVTGASDNSATALSVAGFSAIKALSKRNDEPQKASRPFDRDRDGFVLADGSGILVLEEYEHATRRGANILAEIKGFGMSGDAYHITKPNIYGPSTSMQIALNDAKINCEDIDYINAHGTSTKLGDANEVASIKKVFKQHAYNLKVSSTKSTTGHMLAAAGAVEAIFCILAMQNNIIPPTINLDNPDEGLDLDFVAKTAKESKVNAVINNSFGFGGTNSSIVITKV